MSDTRVSKYLSYVLRHAPESVGIELDAEGFADVDTLVAKLGERYPGFDRAALEGVVERDDKSRYTLRGGRIRANQGHSVSGVDAIDPTPRDPPDALFHGTTDTSWERIRATGGLKRMSRHHVHLSFDEETARRVGSRHRGCTIVLRIHAGQMKQDGFQFFVSDNGVWLVDDVPIRYVEPSAQKE